MIYRRETLSFHTKNTDLNFCGQGQREDFIRKLQDLCHKECSLP